LKQTCQPKQGNGSPKYSNPHNDPIYMSGGAGFPITYKKERRLKMFAPMVDELLDEELVHLYMTIYCDKNYLELKKV
jgi:hypothetical protein